jgi:hypothetical protein
MSLDWKVFAWGLNPVGSAEAHDLLRELNLLLVVADVLDNAVAENDVEAVVLISGDVAGITFDVGNIVVRLVIPTRDSRQI